MFFGGENSSHMDLMSVTFGACSGVTTHCFYFPPPVVIQVFCTVVFEFIFLVFVFLYKNHSPRATAWPVEDTTDRKQGGLPEAGDRTLKKIALDYKCGRRMKYIRTKCELHSSCTSLLSTRPPCFFVSGRSFGFYWVKLRSSLLCTVWGLTHLQNKKWFSNLILSWPIL